MKYEKLIKKPSQILNCQYEIKMLLGGNGNTHLKDLEIEPTLIKGKNIYLFTYPNMMQIYDCITFKKISQFELPITPLRYEIVENNYILIYFNHKLFCYSINFSNNKLNFIFYTRDVYLFKYLKEKKEILIKANYYHCFSKINLKGDITFCEGEKPKIYFEINENSYKKTKFLEAGEAYDHTYEDGKNFGGHNNYMNGFYKDKYIIHIFGDYHYNEDDGDHKFKQFSRITIYDSNNMKEIFSRVYLKNMDYKKLSDILLVDKIRNESVIFYDENTKDLKDLKVIKNLKHLYFNKKEKIFSLDHDNKIAIFTEPNFIHLIDFSTETKKIIKLKELYGINDIEKIGYYSENKNGYLYLKVNQNFKNWIIKIRIL